MSIKIKKERITATEMENDQADSPKSSDSPKRDGRARTEFDEQLLVVSRNLERLNDCLASLIGPTCDSDKNSPERSNCSNSNDSMENLMGTLEKVDERLQDLIREIDDQNSTPKVSETSEFCDATGESRA